MTRKTDSLAYPANPLAAMRELQELDARPVDPPAPAASRVVPPGPRPPARPAGSAVGSATGSLPGSATPEWRRAPEQKPEAAGGAAGTEGGGDLLTAALTEMLARPYSSDGDKGPFTVSTVKILTEVWERLGWAATLTGRPKQEIVAEALKAHFVKILGRG